MPQVAVAVEAAAPTASANPSFKQKRRHSKQTEKASELGRAPTSVRSQKTSTSVQQQVLVPWMVTQRQKLRWNDESVT